MIGRLIVERVIHRLLGVESEVVAVVRDGPWGGQELVSDLPRFFKRTQRHLILDVVQRPVNGVLGVPLQRGAPARPVQVVRLLERILLLRRLPLVAGLPPLTFDQPAFRWLGFKMRFHHC